jgi:hypothetical protein
MKRFVICSGIGTSITLAFLAFACWVPTHIQEDCAIGVGVLLMCGIVSGMAYAIIYGTED